MFGKMRIVLVVLGLLGILAGQAWACLDWLAHCNITFNNNTYIHGQEVYIEKFSSAFSLTDGFGDRYYFGASMNEQSGNLDFSCKTIRLPILYGDKGSLGIMVISKDYKTESIGESIYFSGVSGILYYSQAITKSLWAIGSIGASGYDISIFAGETKPAWSGDPGLYHNGKFYKHGTNMMLSGESKGAFSWSIGLKYKILSALFLEGNYSVWRGATISDFEYKLGEAKVNVSDYDKPKPITIKPGSMFVLGIGIGY